MCICDFTLLLFFFTFQEKISDRILTRSLVKKTFDRGCFSGREIEFAKQSAAIWTFVDESEDLPTLQDINRVVD